MDSFPYLSIRNDLWLPQLSFLASPGGKSAACALATFLPSAINGIHILPIAPRNEAILHGV
jgi:hypothetical protein